MILYLSNVRVFLVQQQCTLPCLFFHFNLKVVEANTSIAAIEKLVNCGQVEELIVQAEDELELLVTMNEDFRIWEADPEGDAEYAQWKDDLFSVPLEEPDAAEFEEAGLDPEPLRTPFTGKTRANLD